MGHKRGPKDRRGCVWPLPSRAYGKNAFQRRNPNAISLPLTVASGRLEKRKCPLDRTVFKINTILGGGGGRKDLLTTIRTSQGSTGETFTQSEVQTVAQPFSKLKTHMRCEATNLLAVQLMLHGERGGRPAWGSRGQ